MRVKRLFLFLAIAVLAIGSNEAKQAAAPPASGTTSGAPSSPAGGPVAPGAKHSRYVTVTVHITGLISFRSLKPATAAGLAAKMVYILNASNYGHSAVVLARNTFKPTGPGVVDGPAGFKRANLGGYSMEFSIAKSDINLPANELTYKDGKPLDVVCPGRGQNTSLYFLPHVSDVVPIDDNSHKLNDGDFDNEHVHHGTAEPNPQKIAGWIKIYYGHIDASLNPDKRKYPIVWDFKTGPEMFGSTGRQQIAQEAVWTFQVHIASNDTLKLINVKDKTNIIELTSHNNKIELWFVNATEGSIGNITKPPGKHESVDRHFRHDYEYFKTYLNDPGQQHPFYIPVVAGVCLAPHKFSSLPCDIYQVVKIAKPFNCQGPDNPVEPKTGDVNCGPTGIP
jgi:hypothetical protein